MAVKNKRRNARRRTAGRTAEVAGRTGRFLPRKAGEELMGEVLSYAMRRGVRVTEADLSGWRRAGVIGSPRREALGRGLGTVSWYPAGTAEIVLLAGRLIGKVVTPALARDVLIAQGHLPYVVTG